MDGGWKPASRASPGDRRGRTAVGESDATELYDRLEETVLPLYHQNKARWIWMMKHSVSKVASYFNSRRMIRRYASEAYLR